MCMCVLLGKAAGLYWTSLDSFPKPVMTKYYFHADKTASMVPPMPNEGPQVDDDLYGKAALVA